MWRAEVDISSFFCGCEGEEEDDKGKDVSGIGGEALHPLVCDADVTTLAALLQGTNDNYATDLMRSLILASAEA